MLCFVWPWTTADEVAVVLKKSKYSLFIISGKHFRVEEFPLQEPGERGECHSHHGCCSNGTSQWAGEKLQGIGPLLVVTGRERESSSLCGEKRA